MAGVPAPCLLAALSIPNYTHQLLLTGLATVNHPAQPARVPPGPVPGLSAWHVTETHGDF